MFKFMRKSIIINRPTTLKKKKHLQIKYKLRKHKNRLRVLKRSVLKNKRSRKTPKQKNKMARTRRKRLAR